jgi:hypothetical protein
MQKFIKVTEGNDFELDKSREWRRTCKELHIPYVVVLIKGEKISIGASIIHLVNLPGVRMVANMPAIESNLKQLSVVYNENIKGYWNFNDMYHLLDFVPETEAIILADKVFDVLRAEINFELKK